MGSCFLVRRLAAQLSLILFSLALVTTPALAQLDRPAQDGIFDSVSNPARGSSDEKAPSTVLSNGKPVLVCGPHHVGQCLKDLAWDQAGIWTSPLRLQLKDAIWLAPFAGATAAALVYDADAQNQLGYSKTRIDVSSKIGAFGSPWATLGEGAVIYLTGSLRHDDHLQETGRLSVEAVINATIVAEGFKLASNRDRPNQGNGQGGFWPRGAASYRLNSSFPSGHGAASWAMARVIASEYPKSWVRVAAYGFATAISVSRVTERQHFPSDALVGSTFGYLIGGYVVRHHATRGVQPSSSFAPIVDPNTRTYGMQLNFYPQDLNAMSPRQFFTGLRPRF
jgi:membrane-associated phospholipid phosphatase